ncbi:hypothetical protein TIFTF001_034124 [Ficus carica]|uniref:Pentatricopeptide repeat-containing protein n=1 Tax=Ficus carica TaxID=3494 RepID=A0AA88JA94_FICCA|nr:hypothetical protein TIFTF001_034124 [Ficus carica]
MENDRNCKLNIVSYNTVIGGLCKAGLFAEAQNLFSAMTSKGIVPDVVACNSLIHGACLLSKQKEAMRLFDEMVGQKITPNVRTFNILVDMHCKEGMVDEAKRVMDFMAREVFDKMIAKGCEPNLHSYSTLINGYCRRRTQAVENLLEEMEARGLHPNTQTRAILLYGLCKNGQLGSAILLLQQMEENKLPLDIVAYNILIEGMCNAGNLGAANDLFSQLSCKGLEPNVRAYTIMINGLLGGGFMTNGEISKALQLNYEMVARGFMADASTSELFVHLLLIVGFVGVIGCKSSSVPSLRRCIDDNVFLSCRVAYQSYGCVVVNNIAKWALCNMSTGCSVVKKDGKEMNRKPNVVAYGSMIDGLCKDGLVIHALNLLLQDGNFARRSCVLEGVYADAGTLPTKVVFGRLLEAELRAIKPALDTALRKHQSDLQLDNDAGNISLTYCSTPSNLFILFSLISFQVLQEEPLLWLPLFNNSNNTC